jgi:hypothetical protein
MRRNKQVSPNETQPLKRKKRTERMQKLSNIKETKRKITLSKLKEAKDIKRVWFNEINQRGAEKGVGWGGLDLGWTSHSVSRLSL